MLGNPGLILRMALVALLFGVVAFGGMMLVDSGSANGQSSVRITLPNGEVLTDGQEVLDLTSQLNGGLGTTLGNNLGLQNGFDPVGTSGVGGSQATAEPVVSPGSMAGTYRYSFEPNGSSPGGVARIDRVGN